MAEYMFIHGELYSTDELSHHGVKGMKWGVRKKREPTSDIRKKYDSTKAAYKTARKDYSKSFDKYYRQATLSPNITKKQRAKRDALLDDTWEKAGVVVDKRKEFKTAKNERKQAIKDTKKLVDKNTKLGDKLVYNDATRKRAAQYMVDNNMSMADAQKKANRDARRNTAIFLGAYGAVTVASLALASKA